MMSNEDSIVSVILARGGSKGIPRKNMVEFQGRPLIAWTIQQVFESGITEAYVSTDSSEIAEEAIKCGALVISRPDVLSSDTASSDEGVIHAINEAGLSGETIVLMPQVTSPLRQTGHIQSLVRLVAKEGFDSAFTANRIDDIGVWSIGDKPKSVTYDYEKRVLRQSRPPMVVENGSMYCTRASLLRESRNRLSGRIGVSIMPKWTMPEIDDFEDLELCAVLMAAYVTGPMNHETR